MNTSYETLFNIKQIVMKDLKRHMIERNGFPKPMGMVVIMLVIVFGSFVNMFFSGVEFSSVFQESQQVIEMRVDHTSRV